MKNGTIKLSLFLNYFVFAILLNTVGVVILQSQDFFGVTKTGASVLEGFKDLPIAIVSFFVASFLPRFGLKRSMMLALGLVTIACFVMPFASAFWYFKILFMTIGISFALIKVSVFATIGLVTDDTKGHSSFMSTLEGVFMIGGLFGNVFFSWFIDNDDPTSSSWLNTYWVLGGLSLLALGLLSTAKLDESASLKSDQSGGEDFASMIALIAKPLVLVFIVSVFMFVLIEQSFGTWSPTFYKEVLLLPKSMSAQSAALLAGCAALGRFGAGAVLQKVNWFTVVAVCTILCGAIVLISLPLSDGIVAQDNSTWFNAPIAAYTFPLMAIFLAPIYPTINSVVLSSLPKHKHSAMAGLIVVFSALGGTTGSMITGTVFDNFDGQTAFYLSLIPMALMLIALWFFRQLKAKATV